MELQKISNLVLIVACVILAVGYFLKTNNYYVIGQYLVFGSFAVGVIGLIMAYRAKKK